MKLTVLLAAALVPGVFLMQATGSSSVAVIDFDRAVGDTPDGKEAIGKLNAFGTEQRAAIDAKLKTAGELESRLRTQGAILTENARAQLIKDLQAAQTDIETMQEDAQMKLSQMQRDLLGPVEKRTVTAVTAYAAERGFKIVLDASTLRNGLVYVHDTADITTEIIRRIAADVRSPALKNASTLPATSPSPSFSPSESFRQSRWLDVNFLRKQGLLDRDWTEARGPAVAE